MKNFIIFIAIISTFFSCKEADVNGYTADTVKKELVSKMNQTEWVAVSSQAYYSKISFDKSIIVLTRNGSEQRVGFDVSNITGLVQELPPSINLVLKTSLPTDIISVKSDYSELISIVRVDSNNPQGISYKYTKVN